MYMYMYIYIYIYIFMNSSVTQVLTLSACGTCSTSKNHFKHFLFLL